MATPTAYATIRLFLDGMLCMMALYALLSYWQQRKAIYWQYALYIVCMLITFALDDADYQRTNYQPGADYYVATIEAVALILYIRFAVLLIDIPRQDPFGYRLLRVIIYVLIIATAFDTLLWLSGVSDYLRSQFYTANRFGVAIAAFVVVPRIIRLRQPVVNYFIVGSLLFTAGCTVALAVNFIPQLFTRQVGNPFSFPVTYMQLGVVGEVLCFTLGMSLRNQQIEREKIDYQQQLIEQLLENERKQQKLQRIREDIARDLHDDVGADLSSIGMLSQAAAGQVYTQPDDARATLRLIAQTARRVVANMREIVWSLNSSPTSLNSFSQRLRETAGLLFDRNTTQLHIELPDGDPTALLPAESRRELFLMVKEMLHNAARHAEAANVWVRVHVDDNTLCISVGDDGRGFKPAPEQATPTGNGLRSLQQRADGLGATLTLESWPGVGTTVTLWHPLAETLTAAE